MSTRIEVGSVKRVVYRVMLPLYVHGQQPVTVAELLAKGGRQLNKDEVQNLVNGATISGTSMNNPAWRSEYFDKMEGRWSVRDDGQLCTERIGQVAARRLSALYFLP